MLIEKTNVELLVPTRGRFQFDLFPQPIEIVRPLSQQGAQHVQFVGEKQVRASVQLDAQHHVETGCGQQQQEQADDGVSGGQPECQG